jgi:hypothetical protein
MRVCEQFIFAIVSSVLSLPAFVLLFVSVPSNMFFCLGWFPEDTPTPFVVGFPLCSEGCVPVCAVAGAV